MVLSLPMGTSVMSSTMFITVATPRRVRSRTGLFDVEDGVHQWRRRGRARARGRMDHPRNRSRQALRHILCALRVLVLGEQFLDRLFSWNRINREYTLAAPG